MVMRTGDCCQFSHKFHEKSTANNKPTMKSAIHKILSSKMSSINKTLHLHERGFIALPLWQCSFVLGNKFEAVHRSVFCKLFREFNNRVNRFLLYRSPFRSHLAWMIAAFRLRYYGRTDVPHLHCDIRTTQKLGS
jgi:hypothetical protein